MTAIKVRATKKGYYADNIQEVGSVFDITDEKHFSSQWMEHDKPTAAQEAASAELAALRAQYKAEKGEDAPDHYTLEKLRTKVGKAEKAAKAAKAAGDKPAVAKPAKAAKAAEG